MLDLDILGQHNLDVSWGRSNGSVREPQQRNTNGGLNTRKDAGHTTRQKHERVVNSATQHLETATISTSD